jgi:hypothetical protein
MRTPGPLIAGAGGWCFVCSSGQCLNSDSPFSFQGFSLPLPLLLTFLFPCGWQTGNALDAGKRSFGPHFIAAFCSGGAVSIVTFPNGASRRPEILFPGPDFPLGGRSPMSEVNDGVARANGKSYGDGVDVDHGSHDGANGVARF